MKKLDSSPLSSGGINTPGGSLWVINGVLYNFGDHRTTAPVVVCPVTSSKSTSKK